LQVELSPQALEATAALEWRATGELDLDNDGMLHAREVKQYIRANLETMHVSVSKLVLLC
jgi:hypothetical protein